MLDSSFSWERKSISDASFHTSRTLAKTHSSRDCFRIFYRIISSLLFLTHRRRKQNTFTQKKKKKKKKKIALFGNKKYNSNNKKESKKKPTNPYRAAHVFFSSPVQKETLLRLQQTVNLIRHLKTCKEVYAEFQVNDSRSFSVDYAGALPALFGERGRTLGECVDACSTRLSTMLSTIGELNANVRYKKGAMNEDGEIIGRNACEAVARQTEYLLSNMREKKRQWKSLSLRHLEKGDHKISSHC